MSPKVLIPTAEVGATTRLTTPYITAEPERVADIAMLVGPFEGTGLNGEFAAEMLSGMLAHERCGVHLYRSVAGRTLNPMMKSRFEAFERETLEHVEVLEDLTSALGADPNYVGPRARSVEAMNSKLLESTFMTAGSADPLSAEMVLLEAVLLGETICHDNWELLDALAQRLPMGVARTAMEQSISRVGTQEDEHLMWARDTRRRLHLLLAGDSAASKAMTRMDEFVTKMHDHW